MSIENPFATGKVVPIGFGREIRRQEKIDAGVDGIEQLMQSIEGDATRLIENKGQLPQEMRVKQSQELQRRIDNAVVALAKSLGDEKVRRLLAIHKQLEAIFFEG